MVWGLGRSGFQGSQVVRASGQRCLGMLGNGEESKEPH